MTRIATLLVAFWSLCGAWPAHAWVGTPTPLVEIFPPNFLETIDCGTVQRGSRLSVDPMSLPPNKTANIGANETLNSTQGERRIMVQKRLYQCTVDALALIELQLPRLTGAAYANALSKFRSAREGLNWPTTPGWLALSILKYHRGVQQTLYYDAGPNFYILADDSYPWTYPENAILLLGQILTIFSQNKVPSPLTPELQKFVTQTLSMAGHPSNSKDFVSNQNVYFNGRLADATKIVQLELNDTLHGEAGAALVCAYKWGEASCPIGVVPNDQRVACIIDAGIALGHCSDPFAIGADEKLVERDNALHYGLPTIAPATRGIHYSLTFAAVCLSVQRANYAHRKWMELARDDGHTMGGFHESWMASLAHAQVHVERALGMEMPPLVPADESYIDPVTRLPAPGLNPANAYVPKGDFRTPYVIRQYVYALAPGVVNGQCDPYWFPE